MKKILLAAFALILTLSIVSCKDKPAGSTGQPTSETGTTTETSGAAEQTVNPVDVKSLVDKAQKEGAQWSVDQWKTCIKDILTVIAPKMIELDVLMEQLKDPEANFPEQGGHPGVPDDLKGGVCVGSIRDKAGISQSTASQYLDVLQRCGLLLSERHGKWTYFRRNEEAIAELARFVGGEL